MQVPLPMAEVWAEMQARVEELTGQAGLQIQRAVLENEVTRRVGPPEKAIGHLSQREPWLPLNQRSALLVSELTGFVAKKR